MDSRLGSHSMIMGKSASLCKIIYGIDALIGSFKKAGLSGMIG